MVDLLSRADVIFSKTKAFYRFDIDTPEDELIAALRQLLEQWSEVTVAATNASDDELFYLNVTRGLLHRIFALNLVKNAFQNDPSLTCEIFELCWDFLRTQLDIFTKDDPTMFSISNIRSIMEVLSNLTIVFRPTDFHLIDEQLLLVMREYADRDSINPDLIDGIFSCIWSLSDHTSLIPLFLQTGYAKSLYQWIEISPNKFRNDQQTALINILQNMSRHDHAVEEFNRLEILTMIDRLKLGLDFSFSLQIIRILLTDSDQIKLESTDFLTQFISMMISASESEDYRHEGSHVCELLTVVAKLSYNDEILTMILTNRSSMVEFFASLLIKLYPSLSPQGSSLKNYACVLLMNILARISYQRDYASIISNNESLMTIVENVTKTEMDFIVIFMSRTMKDILVAANEIQENLTSSNILHDDVE